MNEFLPTQLTAGDLRRALEGVADEVVVALTVLASDPHPPEPGQPWGPQHITVLQNLVVEDYEGGPCLLLRIAPASPERPPSSTTGT